MKKRDLLIFAALIMAASLAQPAAAQEKLAQTGLQFLSVISDARAAALAGTMTGLEANSSAMFFNPATMALGAHFLDVSFSYNQWIADINHNTFSLSLQPANGKFGVFGVSVQAVDYGEIFGTMVANNEQGYIETGNVSTSAFAAGLGYAKMLSDRFGVGGQVRWARQHLGDNFIPIDISPTDTTVTSVKNELKVLSFDFGTIYKTGLKSLTFGFNLRNFSEEVEFAEESFQLPLVFSLGASIDLIDLTRLNNRTHSLLLAVQATNERAHAEQVSFGLEYKFMNVLMLRGGYITNNDEDDVSFGFGVTSFGLQVDYAYTPFGVFDKVQRVTVRFSK